MNAEEMDEPHFGPADVPTKIEHSRTNLPPRKKKRRRFEQVGIKC